MTSSALPPSSSHDLNGVPTFSAVVAPRRPLFPVADRRWRLGLAAPPGGSPPRATGRSEEGRPGGVQPSRSECEGLSNVLAGSLLPRQPPAPPLPQPSWSRAWWHCSELAAEDGDCRCAGLQVRKYVLQSLPSLCPLRACWG